jgi:hypothetical protein
MMKRHRASPAHEKYYTLKSINCIIVQFKKTRMHWGLMRIVHACRRVREHGMMAGCRKPDRHAGAPEPA